MHARRHAAAEPYPAWVANAFGGHPACIDPTVRTAGRTIGLTLVDLLCDADLLAQATAEHRQRTGGDRWVSPLPSDFEPPIELRWPEYIETARGHGWWIP